MDELAPVLGGVGFVLAIGWVIRSWIVNRGRLKMAALKAEVQGKILDKFASAPELAGFLESTAGRQFVHSTTTGSVPYHQRILGSIQTGVIMAAVGAALLLISPYTDTPDRPLLFLGAIALAVGVGFLLAALAAYLLSKRWGLINGDAPTDWSAGPAENPVD